ncbi:MAG: amidohydrolase [Ruminococcaceae bacterium]|nr:amidohydrolase [Oscillospiraceae bacterium]
MLFKNIGIINENFDYEENMYVGVRDGKIAYISSEMPSEDFGEVYDGRKKVVLPGFVNAHTHSPMTLLRGYAENLPLARWLNEKVFPFENRLNPDRAYFGTMLSIAEMLASGTTSFSDMYFFTEGVMKAVKEAKIKVNYSRSITSFEDVVFTEDSRVREALDAYEKYHNTENGRIKIDMCLHAEYTNKLSMIEQFGKYTAQMDTVNHIHVSETESEHESCREKYGKTPTELFESAGVMQRPCLFAHCVWVEDGDIEIFRKNGVSVASCPASNLKLGSGVCDTYKLLGNGVNVALGTDSASSNNGLDMLREMYLASILPKGFRRQADIVEPRQVLRMATVNGARAQGRFDCGLIKEGFCADLTVIDMDKPNLYPDFDVINNIVYSASKSDVVLTMVDGDVLYRDGEYKYIDVKTIGEKCNEIVRQVVREVKENA